MSAADRSRVGRLAPSSLRKFVPGYVGFVYALVLVWGLGDVVSTLFALSVTGSVDLEANPWMRMLLAHEPLLLVALKGAVVLYAGIVLLECRPVVQRVPGWRVWFVGVVGSGAVVVTNNVLVGLAAMA